MTDTLTRTDEAVDGTVLRELEADVFGIGPAVQKRPPSRFSQIPLDRLWIVICVLGLVALILAASIVFSFNQIVAMSGWMKPVPELRWLPAVFIDVAIIAYTLARAVFKYRGVIAWQARWLPAIGMVIATGLSVIANVAHTINGWDGDIMSMEAVIGVGFSAMLPLLAWLATEVLILLAFVDPDEEKAALKKAQKDRARAKKARK